MLARIVLEDGLILGLETYARGSVLRTRPWLPSVAPPALVTGNKTLRMIRIRKGRDME